MKPHSFFTMSLVVITLCAGLAGCGVTQDGPLRIAVAANYFTTAEEIAEHFENIHKIDSELISGSTGKLYAQIENGAPFDVLLAADVERPRLLAESGLGIADSRFTYALGGLVLWSPDENRVDESGNVLSDGSFEHLAIANPQLAPYGRASQDVLQQLGLWEGLQPRLIRGENIAQTLQFMTSGAAEIGLIARSQLPDHGSHWLVPASLYGPIEQQAIIISSTTRREDAERFLKFLVGDEAREIIINAGYRVPNR